MENYKLNVFQVRMASFYILDLITKECQKDLDDATKKKLIKEITEAIQTIKIDDLRDNNEIKPKINIHPSAPRTTNTNSQTFEESCILNFKRLILNRRNKKK